MNNKPALRIVPALLALIIGGCMTTTAKPAPEPTNPAPMETAVMIPSEAAPTATLIAEKLPTPVPEPNPTQDPYPGWQSYTNQDYQFTFRYPATWTLAEEPNLLMLSQGTLLFAIAFQRQGEHIPLPWTGMSAGDFESRGTMLLLGHEIERIALVYEGKVKALTYRAEMDDLMFSIRLDDIAGVDYQAIEISQSTQDETDQILGSFERW